MSRAIRKITILGGGTAGWMVAAALSRLIPQGSMEIELVESESIGTVGVGEATIPHITYFNRLLGLDEDEFVRKTNATFKLGIEFVNWGRLGERYIHPFGDYGVSMEGLRFHHFYHRYASAKNDADVDDYCLPILAARAGKFQRPTNTPNSPLSSITYAFQFDASLYARFMREFAEARGVVRTEGRVTDVTLDAESGHVRTLTLESGQTIDGDLFIDCSGFRGLLIEQNLEAGYQDWSHWLPVNRAVARASKSTGEPLPYTRATAKSAGWQWRIPLQSRVGNGHVYCSDFISDDDALASLNADLDADPISEPNFLRFKTGVRREPWKKNVVSLGLAAGFLEPLESTSIHLIQTAVARLMAHFPNRDFIPSNTDFYNRKTLEEYEQVRDFLILHYKATTRDDTPFWRYVRDMAVPDTLTERMRQYSETAHLYREDNEVFGETSWFAVMHGQGMRPKTYHPIADTLPGEVLSQRMEQIGAVNRRCLDAMPTHQGFIDRFCKAG